MAESASLAELALALEEEAAHVLALPLALGLKSTAVEGLLLAPTESTLTTTAAERLRLLLLEARGEVATATTATAAASSAEATIILAIVGGLGVSHEGLGGEAICTTHLRVVGHLGLGGHLAIVHFFQNICYRVQGVYRGGRFFSD